MLLKQLKKISEILTALRETGLIQGFSLIGGLAVSTWSTPRATRDVDILLLVNHDDLVSLVTELIRAGIDAVIHRGDENDPVPCLIRAESLDIIVATRKLEAEAISHSIEIELGDFMVPVVAPEYLIILKLTAGGPKDLMDVKELLNSEAVDRAKLISLAQRFKIENELMALPDAKR